MAEGSGEAQSTSGFRDLDELREQMNRLVQALGQPTPVNVSVNMNSHHIGTFTGLKPKGGKEVNFSTWRDQVQSYISESNDSTPNQLRKIQHSLKGVARAQINSLDTVQEIVDQLKALYGHKQTAEDVVNKFTQLKPDKYEAPSEYFLRLWDFLTQEQWFGQGEINRKVYYTFITNIQETHPLVELEIRSRYGIPGEVEPTLTEVLASVKGTERASKKPVVTAKAQAQTVEVIDYDRLADLVVTKLKAQGLSIPMGGTPVPFGQNDRPAFMRSSQPSLQGRVRLCYKCNQPGHISRNCRSGESGRSGSLNEQ